MTTPSETVVEVLADGSQVVEVTTTENEEEYDIQIQGSDRRYPAIILRRKDRGPGATIRTISRNGQHSDLYADYAEVIAAYQARRKARRDNSDNSSDNTSDHREEPDPRGHGEGGIDATGEGWIDKTLQSVVRRLDNSPEDTD